MTEYIGEIDMQQIGGIVNELKTIMQSADISVNQIVNALDGKCSRNTILNFFKGDADCKLTTFIMILDAVGAELRMETERSKEAILAGDIAAYRKEAEELRSELQSMKERMDYFKEKYEEVSEKNRQLTETTTKQQNTIEKYMIRMEKAENALYDLNESIKRKDARIVELSKLCDKW